jgi:dynein heavy chain, axonemal
MKNSLNNLEKAYKGEIGMNSELDSLSVSLFNGQIPKIWKNFSPNTKKNLSNWIYDFSKRHEQYLKWINGLPDPPIVLWLSGLRVPESYLTAIIQTTCKKYKWPLDRTTLFTKITKYNSIEQISKKSKDGCFVNGLFLEGATLIEDKKKNNKKSILEEPLPKILIEPLPIIEIKAVENSKLKTQNIFNIPVYNTSDRKSANGNGFVFELNMKSFKHSSIWILKNVCASLESI